MCDPYKYLSDLQMICLRKANEISDSFPVIWKLELDEKINEEEKTAFREILKNPGLEGKLVGLNDINYVRPSKIGIDAEDILSGKQKNLSPVKKYLAELCGKYYAYSARAAGKYKEKHHRR